MDEDTIPDHVDPQRAHVPPQALQTRQELSNALTFDPFGKRPFPWQRAIIAHLNLMTCPASGVPPWPTFFCAPAGGGKSMVRDSFSAGQGFVSWTVTPSLSLWEDQVIKVNANSATGNGAVAAFHLDHCPHPAQRRDAHH
jgi:hypothetical protein